MLRNSCTKESSQEVFRTIREYAIKIVLTILHCLLRDFTGPLRERVCLHPVHTRWSNMQTTVYATECDRLNKALDYSAPC
jgi:hypothetical protein